MFHDMNKMPQDSNYHLAVLLKCMPLESIGFNELNLIAHFKPLLDDDLISLIDQLLINSLQT